MPAKIGSGVRNTPEYDAWNNMKGRCYRSSQKCYKNYGGRGIEVCDRWRDSFMNFYADMGPRPSSTHMLDRIDNNGNYCPENCRWTTRKEQNDNRRTTVWIVYKGERKTLTEWSSLLGIRYGRMFQRYQSGWSDLEIIEGRNT